GKDRCRRRIERNRLETVECREVNKNAVARPNRGERMSTAGSAHRPFGASDGTGEIDLVSRRDHRFWQAIHAARPIRPFPVDELHGRTVTSPLRGGRNLRAQLRPSSEEVVHQCASKFRVGLIWSTYSPPP